MVYALTLEHTGKRQAGNEIMSTKASVSGGRVPQKCRQSFCLYIKRSLVNLTAED